MKYFTKVICSVLLLSGSISNAFGQEKGILIYVGPSRWQTSPPITTVDPVPPLGEEEEKLIRHKMGQGVIKKLVVSFVDRAEAIYTAKYVVPEGFLEWLKKNPKIRSTFWLALNPYYDDIAKAMEVLNELRKFDAKKVKRFYHLAVAFAVVWDTPDAITSSRYACIWGMAPEQFEPLPNYLDNFRHFTNPKHLALFTFKPDQLVWPLLVHVVDMDLTPEEIKWGLKNYKSNRNDIGKAYSDLEYDYNKLRKNPKLGRRKYNFPNLLTYGGICGDQSHFATRLGKQFCVPAMKVSGMGRYGGAGHAWFGCLAIKKNRLELTFSGRYFGDYYYTGDIFDPQTRTNILDREVAMLYDGADLNYHKYINSLILARMAQGLAADKPKVSINLTINALQQNWFCAPAWLILMKHVEVGTLEPRRGVTWLNHLLKYLRKHPDIILPGLTSFLKCIPNEKYQKRNAIYKTAYQIFETAQRPDLLIQLALVHGDELLANGRETNALQVYIDTACAHPEEGLLILPLAQKADKLFRKLNQIKKAIPRYEKIIKRMPKARQGTISPVYQKVAKLLVVLYEEANMDRKAEKLRKTAQLE